MSESLHLETGSGGNVMQIINFQRFKKVGVFFHFCMQATFHRLILNFRHHDARVQMNDIYFPI